MPRRTLIGLLALALAATLAGGDSPAFAAEIPPPHEVEHVRVQSHDGVQLDGWIVRPLDAEPDELPVVLWSSPYFGQCNYYPFPTTNPLPKCDYATGDNPELWDNSSHAEAVPVNVLLEQGYAVAIFNVRGTGNSGGCFSWMGADEQRDQAFLVEWLADRPWSNGRVGMMGLSYHGTTPWEAAVQNPPSLKTIVVAGMIADAYTFSHTHQGATYFTIGVFDNNFVVRVSLSPPINGEPQHYTVDHVPAVGDRLCPDLVKFMTEDMTGLADVRDAAFWAERRLISRFPEVRTAILLTHGFQDTWLSGHQAQEDPVWNLLVNAPKRMLEGQWGHDFPNFNTGPSPLEPLTDWNERLVEWLDYWLKGEGGAPPREGVVDFQDDAGGWHASTSWPPAESDDEVLYLTGEDLSPAPAPGERKFRSYPQTEKLATPELLLCESNLLSDQLGPGGVRFVSAPVEQPVMLAGNPMALLRLSSDMPGGLVAVHLFDLAPDFECGAGTVRGARKLAYGAADLRFHQGNMVGRSFPIAEPTDVRVDITNLAAILDPGHRLAAVVSYGDWFERFTAAFMPTITLHGGEGPEGSHLVLPVDQDATLGGGPPVRTYPPRPFLPEVPPPAPTPVPDPSPQPTPSPTPGGVPTPNTSPDSGPPGGTPPAQGGTASGRRDEAVRVRGRSLRLGRAGRLRLRLACPAAASAGCRGRVRVITARPPARRLVRRLGLERSRGSDGRVRLGTRRFAIRGGTTLVTRVKLERRQRRLLRRRSRQRVRVVAVQRAGTGRIVVRKVLAVRRPR